MSSLTAHKNIVCTFDADATSATVKVIGLILGEFS